MFNTLKIPLLVGGSLFFVWWFFLADIQTNSTENFYTRTDFREDAGTIYYDMGRLALARRDYQAAINAFSDAVTIYPEMLCSADSLGQVFETTHQLDKAFITYAHAMQENAHFLDYRSDPTIVSAEPYKNTDVATIPEIRPWRGESLQGKNLYVYTEKGVGETLMFCRFLKQTSRQAQQIFFKPQAELTTFMRNAHFNKVTIVDATTDMTKLPCAYYTSLLSLPFYLGTTYQRLTQEEQPYLHAPTDQAESTGNLFRKNRFNIGIVWHNDQSSASRCTVAQKIMLSQFYPVAQLPTVQLYSLQHNAPEEELAAAKKARISIINLEPKMHDYASLAAIIEVLDLVIGVESPIIHLSGALGKQTFMLTPPCADWRWFTIGEAATPTNNAAVQISPSVWYKNFLKMQPAKTGSWDPVFIEIRKKVTELSQSK